MLQSVLYLEGYKLLVMIAGPVSTSYSEIYLDPLDYAGELFATQLRTEASRLRQVVT